MAHKKGKEEQRAEFLQHRAKGLSYVSIAREMGISKNTAHQWGKEMGAEVSALKAVETEALLEEYGLLRESQVRQLGGALRKIEAELEGRDFTDVETERLLNCSLKLRAEARELVGQIRPSAGAVIEQDETGTVSVWIGAERAALEILRQMMDGDITPEVARQELSVIGLLLRTIGHDSARFNLDSLSLQQLEQLIQSINRAETKA